MNNIIYSMLDKVNKQRIIDKLYLKDLYEYYEEASVLFKFDKNINKDDFEKIFSTVYEVLTLRLNYEECELLIGHYLKLIIADAKDGENVDLDCFINHVWYLCLGVAKKTNIKQYNDCIFFVQQKLIKEFNIKESRKEKVRRRIITKCLSK